MQRSYLDRPLEIEKWIEELSDSERVLFDKGYILALLNVCESLTDVKLQVYEGIQEHGSLSELQSLIRVLDNLEMHFKQRATNVEAGIQH